VFTLKSCNTGHGVATGCAEDVYKAFIAKRRKCASRSVESDDRVATATNIVVTIRWFSGWLAVHVQVIKFKALVATDNLRVEMVEWWQSRCWRPAAPQVDHVATARMEEKASLHGSQQAAAT